MVASKGLGQQIAPDPQRVLRRADNLSTPTGQLAFKESVPPLKTIIDEDVPLVQTPVQLSRKGFRASIHRTWEQVGKVVRSKSLGLTGKSKKKAGLNGKPPPPLRSFSTSVVASSLSSSSASSSGAANKPSVNASTSTSRHSRRAASESTPTPMKQPTIAIDENEESVVDVPVPLLLVEGTPMTKVSNKKLEEGGVLRVDPELGHLIWHRKKRRVIPLECIKELRTGSDISYYRKQFEQPAALEERWISIVYMDDNEYNTLHLVAHTSQVFDIWRNTLEKLHAVRKELMSGLGHAEIREALWAKQYWKAADEERDHRLVFEEVQKLCKRLCIHLGSEELHRLFKIANGGQKDYLDFKDFEKFGKLLKFRPEVDRLYKKLKGKGDGTLHFGVFEQFMRDKQKSKLSQEEIRAIFHKYSVPTTPENVSSSGDQDQDSPPCNILHIRHPHNRKMTSTTFQAFLMSPENSAFLDQHRHVWQDMNRPLSEYYISSSHNTYLVGHQLIGDSTIEGYIRALLHSCRSVEIDVYADPPSDPEPMVTHGGTLTSKVPLRAVCQAILQYGFIMSPYPIIISAEMHATISGQEDVARILVEVFGDRLIRRRIAGEVLEGEGEEPPEVIEVLPSPEQLKGKILFKTKNLNLVHPKHHVDGLGSTPSLDTTSSSDDSDVVLSDATEFGFVDPNGTPKGAQKHSKRKSGGGEVFADLIKAGTSFLHRMSSVGHGNQHHADQHRHRSASVPAPKSLIDRPKTSLSLPRPELRESISEPSKTPARTVYKPEQPVNSISNVISAGPSAPQSEHANGEGTVTLARRLSRAVRSASPTRDLSSPDTPTPTKKPKFKTAPALAACLVYTVGVKCRGINKKEVYGPEHMFSLSENAINKMIDVRPGGGSASGHSSAESFGTGELTRRGSNHSGSGKSGKSAMHALIKHCRTHLVRIYPKGMRFGSSNYVPHRFWCAGAQLVAINWQTKDLGYMINYAMFQRNGRSGYVLKPKALQGTHSTDHDATPAALKKLSVKKLLNKRTRHVLEITIISAQQLPRPKDSNGIEVADGAIDPFVEVSVHAPDWPTTKDYSHLSPSGPHKGRDGSLAPPSMVYTNSAASGSSTGSKPALYRTGVVKKNGFNPVWEETLRIPYECVGDMQDLIFVRFAVGQGDYKDEIDPLAVYCISLGSLGHGYRHIPLHDTQLSQYLFSTLFVKISIEDL